MSNPPPLSETIEVHDPAILAQARSILDACRDGREMQEAALIWLIPDRRMEKIVTDQAAQEPD